MANFGTIKSGRELQQLLHQQQQQLLLLFSLLLIISLKSCHRKNAELQQGKNALDTQTQTQNSYTHTHTPHNLHDKWQQFRLH